MGAGRALDGRELTGCENIRGFSGDSPEVSTKPKKIVKRSHITTDYKDKLMNHPIEGPERPSALIRAIGLGGSDGLSQPKSRSGGSAWDPKQRARERRTAGKKRISAKYPHMSLLAPLAARKQMGAGPRLLGRKAFLGRKDQSPMIDQQKSLTPQYREHQKKMEWEVAGNRIRLGSSPPRGNGEAIGKG